MSEKTSLIKFGSDSTGIYFNAKDLKKLKDLNNHTLNEMILKAEKTKLEIVAFNGVYDDE